MQWRLRDVLQVLSARADIRADVYASADASPDCETYVRAYSLHPAVRKQ